MAILVALSDLFSPEAKVDVLYSKEKLPTWVAVAYAFIYPVIASLLTLLTKYVHKTLRLEPIDWVVAHTFLFGFVVSLVGIGHFLMNPEAFRWLYLFEGFVSGLSTLFGAGFVVLAFNCEDAPLGPTVAVLNSQIMFIVVLDTLISHTIPYSMQIMGLVCGIVGTLILTIPYHLIALWYCITRQPRPPRLTRNIKHSNCSSLNRSERLSFYSCV